MLDFIIEEMTEKYLDSVVALEQECFSLPWSRASLKDEIDNSNAHFLVAVNSKKNILGYIGFYYVCDEGYITNVAVFKQYRRHGIAKKLISDVIRFGYENNLQFISLEVRKSNVSAILLYESLNFLNMGTRKNFYSRPQEDAFIMTRYLR